MKNLKFKTLNASEMKNVKGGGRCGSEHEYTCTVSDRDGVLASGDGFCGNSVRQVNDRLMKSWAGMFDDVTVTCN